MEQQKQKEKKEEKKSAKKRKGAHLKSFQFVPGESGNPAGRPRGIKREVEDAANDKIEFWFTWLFVKKEKELEYMLAMAEDEDILSVADRIMLTDVNRTHIFNMLDRIAPKWMAGVDKEDNAPKETIEDLLKKLEI